MSGFFQWINSSRMPALSCIDPPAGSDPVALFRNLIVLWSSVFPRHHHPCLRQTKVHHDLTYLTFFALSGYFWESAIKMPWLVNLINGFNQHSTDRSHKCGSKRKVSVTASKSPLSPRKHASKQQRAFAPPGCPLGSWSVPVEQSWHQRRQAVIESGWSFQRQPLAHVTSIYIISCQQ